MAGILDALKLIAEELPRFASEMNVPFSRDVPQSVMREPSPEQQTATTEKALNELLLTLGASALPVLKAAMMAPRAAGVAANAGIAASTGDPTALINGPLGLALSSGDAEAALLPQLFYHGSRKNFKDYLPGLKFFTPNPDTAGTYASGAGGNRGSAKAAGFVDTEIGNIMEYKKGSNNTELLVSAGPDKGKVLPADMDELADLGIYPTESWDKIAEGANIRQVALDVNKMLDARFKGYDRNGKAPPIEGLAELDHQGNRWAQAVINSAKEGQFDWSNTKYPEAQKAWETVLIPQLEAKGYDAIQYWDDMHPTTAVFRNEQIKDVPTFAPTEERKTEAMDNVLRFLQEQGVSFPMK